MVIITTPTKEDARGIQNVFYQTWLATYPNAELGITKEDIEESFKNAFTEKNLTELAERLTEPQEGGVVVVAKDGDRVVGICRAFIREKVNQLQAIYVLSEYQRQGVGARLWGEALKFLDKNKDTIVHVATYNTQAISFYKKLGFEDTGKRFTEERHRMLVSGVLIPEMEMLIRCS